jgi:hypothetical protein
MILAEEGPKRKKTFRPSNNGLCTPHTHQIRHVRFSNRTPNDNVNRLRSFHHDDRRQTAEREGKRRKCDFASISLVASLITLLRDDASPTRLDLVKSSLFSLFRPSELGLADIQRL